MLLLSKPLRDIIQHALGVDQYGNHVSCGSRNYFMVPSNTPDGLLCEILVAYGLMNRQANFPSELFGGDEKYTVTENGKRIFFSGCPAAPKLTSSQRRYQAYLDSDSGLTFFEWLKGRKCESR